MLTLWPGPSASSVEGILRPRRALTTTLNYKPRYLAFKSTRHPLPTLKDPVIRINLMKIVSRWLFDFTFSLEAGKRRRAGNSSTRICIKKL